MVGYVIFPHIHNVVHLVGNLSGGPFLIRAQAASAQSAARSGAKQPPYLSAHLRRLGCEGQPRSTGDTRQQESGTGEERTGNASPPCNHPLLAEASPGRTARAVLSLPSKFTFSHICKLCLLRGTGRQNPHVPV